MRTDLVDRACGWALRVPGLHTSVEHAYQGLANTCRRSLLLKRLTLVQSTSEHLGFTDSATIVSTQNLTQLQLQPHVSTLSVQSRRRLR